MKKKQRLRDEIERKSESIRKRGKGNKNSNEEIQGEILKMSVDARGSENRNLARKNLLVLLYKENSFHINPNTFSIEFSLFQVFKKPFSENNQRLTLFDRDIKCRPPEINIPTDLWEEVQPREIQRPIVTNRDDKWKDIGDSSIGCIDFLSQAWEKLWSQTKFLFSTTHHPPFKEVDRFNSSSSKELITFSFNTMAYSEDQAKFTKLIVTTHVSKSNDLWLSRTGSLVICGFVWKFLWTETKVIFSTTYPQMIH
ncbi:hypothetical protein GQ457_18G008750 [Hibiscus cannabinus]